MGKQRFYKKYRRSDKTDYNKRLSLLKSEKIRLVVRISSKNIIAQLVEYVPKGDKIICGVSTQTIAKEYGWKGPRSNIPVAYLLGLLLAKKTDIKEAILDIGKRRSIHHSKIYAVVKGVNDGGVLVSSSEKVFPSEDRINGEHIKSYALSLKESNKEKYDKLFSGYLSQKQAPEDITEKISDIKLKITGAK
jgi:large subunit ribosomal protein L18